MVILPMERAIRSALQRLQFKGLSMRTTIIDTLCQAINKANGVTYPNTGYLMFSDIRGDGRNKRSVYRVSNKDGGVMSVHNGKTYKQTADNLRVKLSEANIF